MHDPLAHDADALLAELFPICRSITGDGVRESLAILQKHIPLSVREIASGTRAFDWTIPDEWNIRDAWVKGPDGKKIIDFKKSNLHVVGYSMPIRKKMPLADLQKHLNSLPDQPDIIPYKTSYYRPNWGFCIREQERRKLRDGTYEVRIDSSLKKGALSWGELLIPGESKEEVLISSYICHPSMANDSISGVVLATLLAKSLRVCKEKLRYSYRFLFVPETIGAVAWLSKNRAAAKRIRHGLVATCVGDSGAFTYKRSRRGDAPVDKAAQKAIEDSGKPYSIVDFFPWGSDERQYCSPGFDLAIGSLMRSMYGTFPAYHTSGDDLRLVKGRFIAETLKLYHDVLDIIEHDRIYSSCNPHCEPQLGKRGLYGAGSPDNPEALMKERALLWVAAYADGMHSLLDIATRARFPFRIIREAAASLEKHKLIIST